MILRLTLCGLVIVLIVVISLSYYANKEGFETITDAQKNIANDLLNVSKDRYQIDSDKSILKDELRSHSDKDVIANELAKLRDDVRQLDTDKKKLVQDNSSVPQRNDLVPEITVSETGYNAMDLQQKINILKDIQKVVKSDLIANRNLLQRMDSQNNGSYTDDSNNGSDDSISTQQGKEYENGCLKPKDDECYQDTEFRCPKNPDGSCPPLPDMTQYIKKDAIPCWGCSVDY
jgi:hypothetical protein